MKWLKLLLGKGPYLEPALVELGKQPWTTDLVLHTLSFMSAMELLNCQRGKNTSQKWKDICSKAISNKCQEPKKAFHSNQELRKAVHTYCRRNESQSLENVVSTYGYPIDKWDVSQVTNFSRVFAMQMNFNGYIGSWNVSNATNMESMFSNDLIGRSVSVQFT